MGVSADLILACLICAAGSVAMVLGARARRHRVPAMVSEALTRLAAGDPDVRLDPGLSGRDSRLVCLVNALAHEIATGADIATEPQGTAPADGEPAGGDDLLLVLVVGVERFLKLRQQIGGAVAHRVLRLIQRRIADVDETAVLGRLGRTTVEAALSLHPGEHVEGRLLAIKAAIEEPIHLDGHYLELGTAIGYAVGPRRATLETSLLERAELALDKALASHLQLACYVEEDEAGSGDRSMLARDLGRACERGDFFLCYQPKLACRENRIVGAEALIRWQHPERGIIPPDEFIKLAEASGTIRPMTRWVIERAIADQARLAEAGYELEIAVNISGRLLGDGSFAEWALDAAALAVGPICFEITETSVIDDSQRAVAHLDAFAQAGIRIAIDDYGSGLSSLAYLKQLPAHELKVDKQFVSRLASSQRDPLLVRSTIDLAHSLDLKVTAEGVESPAALALLKMMGCDTAQGYLISRPIRIEALLEFLAQYGEAALTSRPQPFGTAFWRSA